MNCGSKKEILAPWCLYTILLHSQISISSTQQSTVTLLTVILARLTACKLSGPYPHIRITHSRALRSLFRPLCQLLAQQARVLSHLPALSPRNPRYLPLLAQSRTAPHTVTRLVTGTTTNTSISLNDCAYIAYSYNVEISDLEAWNPSLSNSSCSLQPGFSYCVQLTASATARKCTTVTNELRIFRQTSLAIVDNDKCQSINQATPGSISSCECWMNVHGYNGGRTFLRPLKTFPSLAVSENQEQSDCNNPSQATYVRISQTTILSLSLI